MKSSYNNTSLSSQKTQCRNIIIQNNCNQKYVIRLNLFNKHSKYCGEESIKQNTNKSSFFSK